MHSGVPTSGSRSSSNPKPTLIRASGAGVRYGTYQALRNIDLTILQGDRLAVIGPNGAGKTTLLRLLLGLESPSDGSVFWSEPRSQIGYVPQRLDFDASFPLTVEEFLAVNNPKSGIWLGGVPRKIKKDITIALAKTGASEVKRQLIGTLSGGQLQRTLIASALLQNPKVLILDEPSASIDKQGAKDLQKLLFDLNKSERITLVFVSHDLHLVSELANRVACLNVNLCGLGEPAEVLGSHLLGYNPTIQLHDQFEQREKV